MRRLSITEWILIICIAMYVVLAVIGLSVLELNPTVVAYVGQYNRFIFERGYVWELLSALFVHFHLGHLIGNLVFLLLFGYRAEDFFNWKQYLIIFLGSGFAGNVLGLALGMEFFSAGASGAIFGLFGSLLYPLRRETPRTLKGMILIGLIFLIFSGVNANVDHVSHWIGFVAGLLLGRYFDRVNWRRRKSAERRLSLTRR
jgi:rhomboid protease GluP